MVDLRFQFVNIVMHMRSRALSVRELLLFVGFGKKFQTLIFADFCEIMPLLLRSK